MKVKTQLPESSKPESASLVSNVLSVDYHKFQEIGFVYTDRHVDILLEHIVSYTMFFGKRRGFKRLEIIYRASTNRALTMLKLSSNHKSLVIQIYNLLKARDIKPRREVITNEDKYKSE